jgi:hypothetical protein
VFECVGQNVVYFYLQVGAGEYIRMNFRPFYDRVQFPTGQESISTLDLRILITDRIGCNDQERLSIPHYFI